MVGVAVTVFDVVGDGETVFEGVAVGLMMLVALRVLVALAAVIVFVAVGETGVEDGVGVAVETRDRGVLVAVPVAVVAGGAVLGVGVDVSVGVFLGSRKAETGTCPRINSSIAAIRNPNVAIFVLELNTIALTFVDRTA